MIIHSLAVELYIKEKHRPVMSDIHKCSKKSVPKVVFIIYQHILSKFHEKYENLN